METMTAGTTETGIIANAINISKPFPPPAVEKKLSETVAKKKQRLFTTIRVLARLGAFRCVAGIEKLPDKILLCVFSYVSHKDVLVCSLVSKRWRTIAYDSRLWQVVNLRPNHDGLQVACPDHLVAIIRIRFAPSLRWLELPMELITSPILEELAQCPKLRYLTLDFTDAMQLHDFSDLVAFPTRLKQLTICLSEVIFLEAFLRRIYPFINSVDTLHLIGTYERVEDEVHEIYEVINIQRLRLHLPSLHTINLFGVTFLSDEHLEAVASGCVTLHCLAVNFCEKIRGSFLRVLFCHCRRLECLLMESCKLSSKAVIEADWDKVQLRELNVTATDISDAALIHILRRSSRLRWFSAGYLERFTDQVLDAWAETEFCYELNALDLDSCGSLSASALQKFLTKFGRHLIGLNLGGMPRLLDTFWTDTLHRLGDLRFLIIGVPEGCCSKVSSRIHVDQVVTYLAERLLKLEELEIRWDTETLRYSDKSSKFIDALRTRCTKLKSLALCDGKYYEVVKENFERAGYHHVVRPTTCYKTSIVQLLKYYNNLLFN